MSVPSPLVLLRRPARVVFAALCLSGLSGVLCLGSAQAESPKPARATQELSQPLVKVDNAWVRQAVPGQTATGGFMTLTASRDLTLVGFSSPAAGDTELHDMVMDGDVMRMRAVEALPLPAGQPVVLRPGGGGQHLMLMGLKRPLKAGDALSLTLKLRAPNGQALQQKVRVPVLASPPVKAAAPEPAGAHPGH